MKSKHSKERKNTEKENGTWFDHESDRLCKV